jgi:hypothetical protein
MVFLVKGLSAGFNKIIPFILLGILFPNLLFSQEREVNSNFWGASDGLGRKTITSKDAGPLKIGKFAGIFYWTWRSESVAEFPFLLNITEILKKNPEAATELNHPAWKMMLNGGFFWWDEPLFGYYRSTDEWVLRKHAQMLANAGIDFVVFDCTNKTNTFKSAYMQLLKVWEEARKEGVNTPKIVFILNFSPNKASLAEISELYKDLYSKGLYKDQWFMWEGKPLIMAYPEMLEKRTNSAGIKFAADYTFNAFQFMCAGTGRGKNFTVKMYKWEKNYDASISNRAVVETTFVDFKSDSIKLSFKAQNEGNYYIEINELSEPLELRKIDNMVTSTSSYINGNKITDGNIDAKISYVDGITEALTENKSGNLLSLKALPGTDSINAVLVESIKQFFTFRPGQPDYVNGPSDNNQWGWLEAYPQNGYVKKADGGYEQVPVGVAQNATDETKGHCCAFNQPGSYGRSYTKAKGQNNEPGAFYHGYNFQEQWNRAFELNPDVVFITGWNEWNAGRYDTISWPNKYAPFSFVDEYNNEKSRDIEPVKSWGNKGDVYYMQMVNNVRKFKGMKSQEPVSGYKSIALGNKESWKDVKPEYTDYKGDTTWRDTKGQGEIVYTNHTGRNDIVLAKVARDKKYIYFYVETASLLSPQTDSCWMNLWINADRNNKTGWEGYDYAINRVSPAGGKVIIEKAADNEWKWKKTGTAEYKVTDKTIEIKVPRKVLDILGKELNFEFKWSDNSVNKGDIMDFYVNGDAAPDGRFNYIYSEDTKGNN